MNPKKPEETKNFLVTKPIGNPRTTPEKTLEEVNKSKILLSESENEKPKVKENWLKNLASSKNFLKSTQSTIPIKMKEKPINVQIDEPKAPKIVGLFSKIALKLKSVDTSNAMTKQAVCETCSKTSKSSIFSKGCRFRRKTGGNSSGSVSIKRSGGGGGFKIFLLKFAVSVGAIWATWKFNVWGSPDDSKIIANNITDFFRSQMK